VKSTNNNSWINLSNRDRVGCGGKKHETCYPW
jgi:hypothetical protein